MKQSELEKLESSFNYMRTSMETFRQFLSGLQLKSEKIDVERDKVEVPGWITEQGFRPFSGGDAAHAYNDYFKWFYKVESNFVKIVILSTDLRGPLILTTRKDGLNAAY